MSLSWLVSPQYHKITNGYYLNHDNLMLASSEQRRRLIFYYIASQTPEKLSKEDYEEYQQARLIDFDFRTLILTTGFTVSAFLSLASQSLVTTRISRKPFFNAAFIFGAGCTTFGAALNISQIMFEPLFISQNKTVATLAQKYQFSVFDFALAKKEARLKQLRAEFTSDSSNAAHM